MKSNKAHDETLELHLRWVKEHFWFLVTDYGLRYDGYVDGHYDYKSEKVGIRIELGHKTPSIFITLIEPRSRRLTLDTIIYYFNNDNWPYGHIDFQARSLEQNIRFYADVLRDYANRIVVEIEDWWLPAQKSLYKALEKEYSDSGQISDFLASYEEFHDYLKSKGAL